MPSLPIYNIEGVEVGKYEIAASDLVPSINKQLLHDVVVMYQASKRQGTHKTKSRGQVKGSTKKMYRQKGTGNARAGSRRSGVRRGGGHIKSRQPRDYSYRLPRKAVRAATRMAIASKIEDEQIVVIDSLSFDAPRTRDMVGVLGKLGLAGVSTLVTTEGHNVNVYKSSRNIPRVSVSPVTDLNALSVLTPQRMLVTKAALDALKDRSASKADDDN